jgi:hypothetical protein
MNFRRPLAKKKRLPAFAGRGRAGAAHPGVFKKFQPAIPAMPLKKMAPGPATQFPAHGINFSNPLKSSMPTPRALVAEFRAADFFMKAPFDGAAFLNHFYITSLPFVSTAGRGAAPSGAALAFFRGSFSIPCRLKASLP